MTIANSNTGFTIIETVIVVIIIGVLVSLALPNFFYVHEKTKAAEGVQILESIRRAQWAYYYDDGGAQNFADDLADLDLEIPAPENFDVLDDTHILTTANPSENIAMVRRSTGLFQLYITADGDITCSGAGSVCAKVGF